VAAGYCQLAAEARREREEKEKEWAARAAEVAALVESSEDSRVYVCGDGGGMARDVHAALVDALAKHAFAGDEAKAAEKLAEMTKQGRYVRDIWS